MTRHVLRSAARSAAIALLWTAAIGTAFAQDRVDTLVRRASDLRHQRKYRDSIAQCESILAISKASNEQRVEAFDILIDVYRRQRKWADVIKVAERMRRAFPEDKANGARSLLVASDAYRDWGKYTESVTAAQQAVEQYPDQKAACADAHLKAAYVLLRIRKYPEAWEEARQVLETSPDDDGRVAEALWHMKDAKWRVSDFEKCFEAVKQLSAPKYLAGLGSRQYDVRRAYGDCLMRLERYGEAATHYEKIAREHDDHRFRQECLLRAASAYTSAKLYDKGLAACERVFLEHPQLADRWYSAQRQIVTLLQGQGKFKEAIHAARICLDAVSDARYFDRHLGDVVRIIAELFKGVDHSVARANQFINYQRFGPAGEDGKPGTADDLADPLAAFPRPTHPKRAQLFAVEREKAGDDAMASRYRALTWLYTGHPDRALEYYLDAFGRATSRDFERLGHEMVLCGARAVCGHAAGLERFYKFVSYGPDGPDGKPKTADDLEDPFAPLLKRKP